MKKFYFLSIFFVLINVISAFAVADITYYFYTGSFPVKGVQTIGYTCTNSECSAVTNTPFSYNGNSGINNYLTVSYPTLLSTYGYAIYYFKTGYVPMEYIATWHGTGSTTYDINFYKISNCKSTINSFSVSGSGNVDEVATLQANIKSAFSDAHIGPEYIIPAYKDEFYSSYINVNFKVYDSSSNLVYSNTQTLNIFMDESKPVSTTWTPAYADTYTVYVYTDVTDNQCSSYLQQSSSKTYVVESLPYCGDGALNNDEQCELPNTYNNEYCTQTTSQCLGHMLGIRDEYGSCDSGCGCIYDTFEYGCAVGSCGAECDTTHDCAETECDSLDGCVGNNYYDYNDVSNACLSDCICANNQCGSPVVYTNDPRCTECQTDYDCNYLDNNYCVGNYATHDEGRCVNYECEIETTTVENCASLDNDHCSGDYIMHDEGMCIDYECATETTMIYDCNDYNVDYCDGTEIKNNDYTCSNANCVFDATITLQDCDDNLYCNGQESCSNANCVAGNPVDCSGNNLAAIATCSNNPDSNPFTWDYFVGFTSTCNEASDSCTTGTVGLTHTCSVAQCGAECDEDSDCDDENELTVDGCLEDCTCSNEYLPYCGDGNVDPGEDCDDGNDDNYDQCNDACLRTSCSDSKVQQPNGFGIIETCDDGNRDDGDGCNSECQLEYCGDGIIQDSEECDDGNNINGDGCSDECEIEHLDITSLVCFDHIIVDNNQSCSVYVEANGVPVANADVAIYFLDETLFNTCTTNHISGGCEAKHIMAQTGTYTVYATAEKEGYISDDDTWPRYTFDVLNKRYDIINLKVYNNSGFTNEDYDFYRAENLYVSFQVIDLFNDNALVGNIVTKTTLVSPPGGRADLTEIAGLSQPNYYYYELTPIPPTHDFLGLSQVFTFAFNFSDNSGGQKQVDLTIRNNPPVIVGTIPGITLNFWSKYTLDLSPYESDIEDSGDDLRWSVSGVNTGLINAIISNKNLAITPLKNGQDQITLALTDLDDDSDSQDIIVTINVSAIEPPVVSKKPKTKLQISRIILGEDEIFKRNSDTPSYIALNNIGDVNLDDVAVTLVIPELGLRKRVGHMDIDSDDEIIKIVNLEIPDVQPGNYDVRITISNDNIRRVKHRVITII